MCAGIAEQQVGLLALNISTNGITPEGMHHIAVMLVRVITFVCVCVVCACVCVCAYVYIYVIGFAKINHVSAQELPHFFNFAVS